MDQKMKAECSMEVGIVGELDKKDDTSPGKGTYPTKEDHDQLGQNNTNVIQDEINSAQAELSSPKLLPLRGDEEKVDHDTNNNQVAENQSINAELDQAHCDDELPEGQDNTKTFPTDPVDCENHGDGPPAEIPTDKEHEENVTNTEVDITTAGKRDLGTPNIIEDIAELCVPPDDNISEDQDTKNHDLLDPTCPREQGIDDHSVEGEHPTQDQIGNQKDCPISGGKAGANSKEKSAGAEEQLPKIPEDIAELCLPNPNPPLQQDDIIGEEEKLSPPGSLSSQDDPWVTPRPPPDDEGGSTKQNNEMGLGCRSKEMSCGEKEEEVISQSMSLSSNDENLQMRKRSMNTEKHNFKFIKYYEGQLKRENESGTTYNKQFKAYCKQSVRFVNFRLASYKERQALGMLADEVTNLQEKLALKGIEIGSLKKECAKFDEYRLESDQERQFLGNKITDLEKKLTAQNSEITSLKIKQSRQSKGNCKQCVRYMKNAVKWDEDIANLQREMHDLKVALNSVPPSDGLEGKEAELPPNEE